MFLIDLLFPKFCLGCGYVGVYLCRSCQNKLKPIKEDLCLYCKKPSPYGLTHPNCSNKLSIDGMIALYYYNPILKKIIKNIKYRLATEVWKEFYRCIKVEIIRRIGFYKKLSLNCAIQPIPLSKNKFLERGFNQAQMISDYFSQMLNYPVVDFLIREKETESQAQITDKKDRFNNMRGAFVYKENSKKNVTNMILVDDVVTSGATIKVAAKVLKANYFNKVYVLALAKG